MASSRNSPGTAAKRKAADVKPPSGAHTSEERRVPLYHREIEPTQAGEVTAQTPLDRLYLNWTEKQLPERERTKHVHRIHPYLGKYIPQLVEIFLRKYFAAGTTVLDPFSGSGTTLVQANELGVHSIGCDVSAFNVMINRVKTRRYDIRQLKREVSDIMDRTARLTKQDDSPLFDDSPGAISADAGNEYLQDWFAPRALEELLAFRALIPEYEYQEFLKVVLSRSARSARRTTHFDLDFPKKPITEPYHCHKHGRICAPTEVAYKFLVRYCADGMRRVEEFSRLRTSARVQCLHGDSRDIKFPRLDGVITSPPYVGLIDYHEQHRYAYELLGLEDNGAKEIGPASQGQSKSAQAAYAREMTAVFRNVAQRVRAGGRLIVVAGDRHGLYPDILSGAGLAHEATLKRHVNRRTGRRGSEFYESIFIYAKQ